MHIFIIISIISIISIEVFSLPEKASQQIVKFYTFAVLL